MNCIKAKCSQQGFSIVELMVAAVLGILLIGGVVQLFLGSNRNYAMQSQLANMQEDGRLALLLLKEHIEMAGSSRVSNSGRIVTAIDAGIHFEPIAVEAGAGDDGDTPSDSIAIKMISPKDNLDCNGAAVEDGKVVNTFRVNASNELECLGNGGRAAQPIIAGVKSFRVLYGVETETSCPDGIVGGYYTKAEVISSNLQNHVHSVKVGLLLESEKDVWDTQLEKAYDLLGDIETYRDKKLRRVFQQTIYMPNATFNSLVNGVNGLGCI